MASIGHIAVGMAVARVYPRQPLSLPGKLGAMVFWSALSLAPDADVIGFKLGVPYHAAWGHRGATHSFAFCFGAAVVIALCARAFSLPVGRTFVAAAVALVSHPLLDVVTDGGLGCALFWPLSTERHFAPWNPIPVAPIGKHYFSARGLSVALTELLMFSPLVLYALWPRSAKLRAMSGWIVLLVSVALCACTAERSREPKAPKPAPAIREEAPASEPTVRSGPRFVPGMVPVAPFVAEQLLDAPPGERTLVYVGATWCEPCQRFHRAVEAGELDTVLPGVRLIEYDIDAAKPSLAADGYQARLIPIFARPGSDGRAAGTIVAGSIKGDGAVQNIVPRLQALLAEPAR